MPTYCAKAQAEAYELTEEHLFKRVLAVGLRLACIALLCLYVSATTSAEDIPDGVTVEDLVTRTLIPSFSVSPDGDMVAFLAIKADPWRDDYEIDLYLENTNEPLRRISLARYRLKPEDVFDANTHAPYKTVSQYVWSADSRRLLYTVHTGSGMELRIMTVATSTERSLISGHEGIQIDEPIDNGRGWKMIVFDHPDSVDQDKLPKDYALRIEDGFRLYAIKNPKIRPPLAVEQWEFSWENSEARKIPDSRQVKYFNFPEIERWDGHSLRISPCDCLPAPIERGPKEKSVQTDHPTELLVDIGPDRSVVSVRHANAVRKIYEDDAILVHYYAENTDPGRRSYLSDDSRLAVMLKSTNLVPDELVALDLRSGTMRSLFSPNERFSIKTRGISVRKMTAPAGDTLLSGRLFLPPHYAKGKRYPLVFVPYLATPGFNLSDEIPILPLLAHDIAVFALHSTVVGKLPGHDGDFGTELRRVEIPRLAMEWIVNELSHDGTIDATRCGVGGLSYGAETAMYAYWRSDIFRAVSATTGSWEPIVFSMGGLAFAQMLEDRGYPKPRDGTYGQWKRLSASLNARSTLPPLLWQSPERERFFEMQSWLELRRAGAQVEWLEYPDEGHTKRHPANDWWVNQRNLDWFRFWLRDREDTDPVKAAQYARWREMRREWTVARDRTLTEPQMKTDANRP